MNGVLRSCVAGAVATVPMTAVMELGFRVLPRGTRYPLPPRLITDEIDAAAGEPLPRDERSHLLATLIGHFGYGAAAGSGFALVRPRGTARAFIAGMAYGLAVWVVSYMGWLPAVRLMPTPAEQPRERSALMIAAHVVWGGSLGLIARGR